MLSYEELIKNISVLLVDDDEDYLGVTYSYLKMRGYIVDKVTNAFDALEIMKTKNYQIMLIDYFMPSMSGEELINKIREKNKEVIIILQTGFSGQKPPIESMQKLNIQNYHDKTEGIDRLNLELISAVKIFNQQNEIALTKYRSTAIGNLMSGIATEIKSTLMSIGAGIEYSNMLIAEAKGIGVDPEKIAQISKFSNNNKDYLERIDKILTAVINQVNSDENDDVILDKDIMEIVELILKSEIRSKNIILDKKIILKSETYLTGRINDTIFIICEFIRKLIKYVNDGEIIGLTLTEDENNWYFNLNSDKVNMIDKGDIYLFKCIVISVKKVEINISDNMVQLIINKTK
ncbi:MAG: response regulator [Clostridia bacterium]|nr:response regulator [Clostridia bacterium]